MDPSTISLSNSISKKETSEAVSLSWAAVQDARNRPQTSITNEQIKKGDPILGTYTVLEDAIPGGMGNVWKVHHNTWNVDLAMKRPQPAFFSEAGEERKSGFIAECENWINLGLHPNIVSCYYVREIGGVPTIFSEWMENGSLKDRILDGTLFQGSKEQVKERVLDIAIQALRGLKYSHEKGLIHQDMKPGNLLLSGGWNAKIADFGLARAVSSLGRTIKNLPSGYTPAYCPCEQAKGEPVEPWMDLYAWALTVIEMLAEGRFWEKGADKEWICSQLGQHVPTDLPDPLLSILKRCLFNKNIEESEAEACLLSVYQSVTGYAYKRILPDDFDTSVDNLNNKALSMLDLGMPTEARRIWRDTTARNHRHLEMVYNNALFLWRQAEIDGYEAYQRIREADPSKDSTPFLDEILRESGCGEDHFSMDILPDVSAGNFPGWGTAPKTKKPCKYAGSDNCPKAPGYKNTEGENGQKTHGWRMWWEDPCPWSERMSCTQAELAPASAQMCREILGEHYLTAEDDEHFYAARCVRLKLSSDYDSAGPKFLVFDKASGKLQNQYFWDDPDDPKGGSGVRQILSYPGRLILDTNTYIHVYHSSGELFDHMDLGDHILQVNEQKNVIAAGCSDGVIYAWSAPEMDLLFTGHLHKRQLTELTFSHQGDMLASFDNENEVRIWSVPAGRCVKNLYSLFYNITGIAFSKDDHSLEIWFNHDSRSVPIGPFTYKAPWYLSRIGTTEEAINDKQLFLACMEEAGKALDRGETAMALDRIAQARSLPGYEHHPEALALKRRLLKKLGNSGVQDVWETAAFQSPEEGFTWMSVSGDSIFLLCSNKVYEYDLQGQLQRSFPSVVGEPAAMDISVDGRFLITAGSAKKGCIAVHDLSDGHVRKILHIPFSPSSVAFDRPAGMFAVAGWGSLEIYSFPSCKRIWKKSLDCLGISWNAATPVLYAGSSRETDYHLCTVTVKGFLRTKMKTEYLSTSFHYFDPAVSSDGGTCFYEKSPNYDETLTPIENVIACRDLKSNTELGTIVLTRNLGLPTCSAYTPDNRFMAIGTNIGSIGIYNCKTLQCEPNLRPDTLPKNVIGQMAWNKDSSTLVCACWVPEKETRIMDIHVFYVDWVAQKTPYKTGT